MRNVRVEYPEAFYGSQDGTKNAVIEYKIRQSLQKKNKSKKQEYRNFIDWFIAVPAKTT